MAIQGFFTGDVKIRELNGVLKAVNGIVEVATDAGTVTSVGIQLGTSGTDANVANSPITTSGNITLNLPTASATNRGLLSSADWTTFNAKQGAITLTTTGSSGAATLIGTTLNIPNYSGALTGYVPYVGATTNVDLGEFELKAGQFTLDVSPTGTAAVGTTRWNNTIGSSETTLKGGTVILKNGVDLVARVVNKVFPNATLTKAAYQAVRVSGAQGQRLAVSYAQADGDPNSADTIGLVTETIATNQEGFIMTVGQLEGINTTGSLQGETWTDGDVLYLSPTIPGAITNIKPSAPQHLVVMGYVEYAHANNGKIYVKIMNGWELGELHDVNTTGAINGSVLKYNGTIWVPSSDTGITSLNGLTALSQSFATGTSGTDFNIASATATHTFNLPTASATNRGALSSADWTTFNSKQTALSGTGFVKISGTTISYDNSTYYLASNPSAFIALTALSATAPLSYSNTTGVFSISQATTSTNGYLSSTDWNTFNNKQPAGSYITALTGEATASGPGSATVTLSTSAVTGKLLTGLNLTGGGSIAATDSILQAFGKVQNQISGLAGGVTYQGVWNASTNTPTLTSSVGTKGYYYIVDVAGSTNLNGITDWKVGDWVIFNGSTWDKVDNTDAVSSVNGFTGAVSLTTSNIAEGTNLYYLDSRARLALSFTAGSGAYNNTTGVITIPTNTSQLTNGANFITLSSLSASSPLAYNSGSGAFSIQVANGSQNGYLSSSDWTTFNSKQNAITLTTTGSSGSSTLVGATLNVPTYTLSGLGGVPTSRQLTINGTAYDLSADRSWSVGTVTSVGLSSATSGVTIGSTPITTSGTITLAIATASGSAQGLLSSTDWTTFNNKQNALTNPVTGTGTTNYLPKFTGASTIGNSNITDTGSLITLGSNSYVNGNVGIGGTAVPYSGGAKVLNVISDTTIGEVRITNSTTGNAAAAGLVLTEIGVNGYIVNANNGFLAFATNNTTKATLNASGNLSIGNTNDTYKLDVQGSAVIRNDGAAFQLLSSSTSSQYQKWSNGGGNYFVGISSSAGLGLLNSQNAYSFCLQTESARDMSFGTNNLSRMTIFSDGNVGINTGATNAGFKLDVNGTGRFSGALSANSFIPTSSSVPTNGMYLSATNTLGFATNGTLDMILDASGNLGLGVTPSAWASTYKSYQLPVVSIYGRTDDNDRGGITSNAFFGASGFTYVNNGFATLYEFQNGDHRWHTAPSGTAGNAISFTQAMTLDASGNLMVGGTSVYGATITSYGSATRSGGIGIRNSAGTIAGSFSTYAAGSGSGSTDIFVESAGFMAFSSGGSERLRITSGGNVGIGNTSPNNLLTLYSASSAIYTQWVQSGTGTSSTDGLRIGLDASSNGIINLNEGTALITSIDGTERMRITSGGDVVVGGTTAINSSSGRGNITVNGTSAIINLGISNVESGYIFHNGTNLDIAQVLAQPLRFLTSNAERMRITSGGNVGIGTTSPAAILHTQQTSAGSEVTGLLIQNVGNSASTAVSLNFAPHENASSPTTLAKISAVRTAIDNAPTNLVFHTFNNTLQERMRITSGGNLLVGTTADSGEKLQVNGNAILTTGYKIFGNSPSGTTSSFISLYNTTDGGIDLMANFTTSKITFGTAGSERMRITSGGLVGIGTTAPNSLLEVNRTITFSSIDTYAQLVVKTTSGANGKLLNIGVDETNSVSFIQSLNRGTDAMPLSLQRYGGAVLIGTTTEGFLGKLQVAGSVAITGQYNTVLPSSSFSYFDGSGQVVSSSSNASALYLDTTWNTTGNPDGIYLNVTNTASGASSKLLNLKVGSVSQFSVSKAGAIQTTAPTGGTAQPWKLGTVYTGTCVPSDFGSFGSWFTGTVIEIEVNGTTYKIPAVIDNYC